MSNKRKLIDIDKKCRLCLSDGDCLSYLFDATLLPKIDYIAKCTSIDIAEEKDLPNKICHVCLYKLDLWSDFQDEFVKTNELLLAHLEAINDIDSQSDLVHSKRKHIDHHEKSDDSSSQRVEPKKVRQDGLTVDSTALDHDDEQSIRNKALVSNHEEIQACTKDNDSEKNSGVANNANESETLTGQRPPKPTLVPLRVKHFGPKRGKTTEKRKASTKRWVARVARKKALLAATGDYASDTDSVISENESKLSPVQKARAKTNADKEVEKRKRIFRALKILETDMKGTHRIKYDSDIVAVADTDSDHKKHMTRSQRGTIVDGTPSDLKTMVSIKTEKEDSTGENRLETVECTLNELAINSDSLSLTSVREKNDQTAAPTVDTTFKPLPIRSEVEVGDATYIVTSTLVLSDGHGKSKNSPNLSKDSADVDMNEDSQERNTDIIDAVQLRRINPKSSIEYDDSKLVERCLNIEVEGTELIALQRVQAELALFVEMDLKKKILNNETSKPSIKPRDSYQTLDQQLKTIVENAIKKNMTATMNVKRAQTPRKSVVYRNRKTSTFSPAFIRAAMRSKIFQPKVILTRMDLSKAMRRYKINNLSCLAKNEERGDGLGEATITPLRKRKVALNRIGFHNAMETIADSENSEQQLVTSTPNVRKPGTESSPATTKVNNLPRNKILGKVIASAQPGVSGSEETSGRSNTQSRRLEKICETVECDTTTKPLPSQPIPPQTVQKTARNPKSENVVSGANTVNRPDVVPKKPSPRKYSCDVRKQPFDTLREAEEHAKIHEIVMALDANGKQKKPRMMRCKRCHEIVDARLVRIHRCRSPKIHKCYVCNSIFRSEKMLICHLETHDESEFSIENIERGQTTKNSPSVSSTQIRVDQRPADSNTTTNETSPQLKTPAKEIYTCFVCDKKFTDENVLKDHLQQHCDDVSDEEAGIGKERYQCAICGDTLDSEEALEAHVEKHLFDDEDDNPNLISIPAEPEASKQTSDETFHCLQCPTEFSSEILLAMHTQAHEEEAAIAEWEKDSTTEAIVDPTYSCSMCDEVCDTEAEFDKHIETHNSDTHVCFLCDQPFVSMDKLRAHVENH